MRNQLRSTAIALMLIVIGSGTGLTQEKAGPTPPVTTLKVQIVISRFQGDKKLSSLPYTLSVIAGNDQPPATIRMGTQVPVASAAPPMVDGKPVGGPGFMTSSMPFSYREVGTNIDCAATALGGEGWFRLVIGIQETSAFPSDNVEGIGKVPGIPAFRTYGSSNTVILRDGQSAQFTTAADRTTGEVIRGDVTLTVVK
jgi:hypothetical protein